MKSKAVFLDRDGVINKDSRRYIKSLDELRLINGIFKYIQKLNDDNFKVIVISNQSAINRGLTTKKEVDKIHNYLQKECRKNNCKIDAIYYCPHRPDENCSCRKPKIGLILKAAKNHSIDLKSSWFIGDKDSDIKAGKRSGCRTFKVRKNGSLRKAVKLIILTKNK